MTYLTEFRDTVGLSALRLGIDPTTITQEQFEAALAPIQVAVDNGDRARHHRQELRQRHGRGRRRAGHRLVR